MVFKNKAPKDSVKQIPTLQVSVSAVHASESNHRIIGAHRAILADKKYCGRN